jgi:Recombinase
MKAALAAAKVRGMRLGTPDPVGAVERMRVARKAQAAQFAANVLPIIRDIQAAGHTSLNAIAGQLNVRKVATANGGQWRHVQVRQILDRAARTGSSDATHPIAQAEAVASMLGPIGSPLPANPTL